MNVCAMYTYRLPDFVFYKSCLPSVNEVAYMNTDGEHEIECRTVLHCVDKKCKLKSDIYTVYKKK